MDTEKKSEDFALKNITESFLTYPKTAVVFVILMALPLLILFTENAPVNLWLTGILSILIFFPMYVLVYALKKQGKSFFLRLFWLFMPLYFVIIPAISYINVSWLGVPAELNGSNWWLLRVIITFYSGACILAMHVLSGGFIFFLGQNNTHEPQKKSRRLMCRYYGAMFLALVAFLAAKNLANGIITRISINVTDKVSVLSSAVNYSQKGESDKTEPIDDCLCIIMPDYDKIVSSYGKELDCFGLNRCDCGHYYLTCIDDNKHLYTGYAEYRDAGRLVRKIYYEKGEVNRDLAENYYDNGQVAERSYIKDKAVVKERYSEDGEMLVQVIKKEKKHKNENVSTVSEYTTYSKEYKVVGYVDKENKVRGLDDKIVGYVGKRNCLVCDAEGNYIGYIENKGIDAAEVKSFRGDSIGEITQDEQRIISDDGKEFGSECGFEKIAYDAQGKVIGIAVIERGESKGSVVGINEEGKAERKDIENLPLNILMVDYTIELPVLHN